MKKYIFLSLFICFILSSCSSNENKINKDKFIGTWIANTKETLQLNIISEYDDKLNVSMQFGDKLFLNNDKTVLTKYELAGEVDFFKQSNFKRKSTLIEDNAFVGEWHNEVDNIKIKIEKDIKGNLFFMKLDKEQWQKENKYNEIVIFKNLNSILAVQYKEEYIGKIKENYIMFEENNNERLYYNANKNTLKYTKVDKDPNNPNIKDIEYEKLN